MLKTEYVIKILKEIIESEEEKRVLNNSTSLLGPESNLDSMTIVQLFLALEEKALEFNFEFDWTSEKAMSSMNSIFKSPDTLTEEFNRQLKISQKE
tara:strand:+ start:903 stop:1190 length:288 start_codon:yes stop_codon:yes gene_type:complete